MPSCVNQGFEYKGLLVCFQVLSLMVEGYSGSVRDLVEEKQWGYIGDLELSQVCSQVIASNPKKVSHTLWHSIY